MKPVRRRSFLERKTQPRKDNEAPCRKQVQSCGCLTRRASVLVAFLGFQVCPGLGFLATTPLPPPHGTDGAAEHGHHHPHHHQVSTAAAAVVPARGGGGGSGSGGGSGWVMTGSSTSTSIIHSNGSGSSMQPSDAPVSAVFSTTTSLDASEYLPSLIREDDSSFDSKSTNDKNLPESSSLQCSSESISNEELPEDAARRRLLVTMLAAVGATTATLTNTREAAASDAFISLSDIVSNAATSAVVASPPAEEAFSSSTASAAAAVVTDIMKPPLDDRRYEAYTLENGMRVLLCSDPKSSSMAAAVDVHVGATSDPEEVPGLAHFNEHMLFLGTKSYPREDGFSAFLSSNGGTSNAFTAGEDTVYYFSMDGESDSAVAEGLDRFAAFFSCPLFTQSATGRELNAIESENAKNLQSDVFRLYQIEKSRANRDHPYSKFFTGNKSTLYDGTQRRGIDLRAELLSFYERYYTANQMTLAVVAPQSLDVLRKQVQKVFSVVKNNEGPKPEERWNGVIDPFPKYDPTANGNGKNMGNSDIPGRGHIVSIVPVQELRQVSLAWPISYTSKEERDTYRLIKPEFFVSHLLGHEGSGSLLSFLKSKGWANGLASSTSGESSDFFTFDVTVELTNAGLAAVDDVIEAVFSYILGMLRDGKIPDYVFEEVLRLTDLEWRFLSKGDPANYVQSLVSGMQEFEDEPSLYVAGKRRIALLDGSSKILNSSRARDAFASKKDLDFAASVASGLISKLTVEDVMVTILSKSVGNGSKRLNKEKWYGTLYDVKPIPPATLARWSNGMSTRTMGVSFPKPNVFIPSEEGLKIKQPPPVTTTRAKSLEERMKPNTPPHLIRDDGIVGGRWTVHFKEDDRFGQPKAFVIFQLVTSKVYSSATSAALALLYQTCAVDSLQEYTYDATLAGLTYDVQVLPRGVRLTFGGYNDKLQDFATYVATKLAKNVAEVLPRTEKEFERYKDRVTRSLAAFDVKQPYSHAIYYTSLVFQPRRFNYSNADIRKALKSASLPQLNSYVKTLWSSGKGEALVQGNLEQGEALELVKSIDEALGFKPMASEDEYPPRITALPLPTFLPTKLRVAEPNPNNKNSVTQVVLQCLGRTEKDHMMMELLSVIVEDPFYDDLRTRQQLGYIVSSGLRALEESRNLSFLVQSSVAPANKLTTAVLTFLDGFRRTYLEKLTEADLSRYVKGLVDNKLEPDKTLSTEVTRNWNEITSGRMQFNRIQREAAALLDITKEDLLGFWDEILYGTASSGYKGRKMLISEVIPRTGPASSMQPQKMTGYNGGNGASSITLGIDDIERFRKERENIVNT